MTNVFEQELKRVKAIFQVIPLMIREIAADETEFIQQLNQDQLREGQRPDGSFLPDYSPTSVSVFGKPDGPIQLFDKGDFYEGITPEIDDDFLEIVGKDSKTNDLISRYGNVLGLTEESKILLCKKILPLLIERLKKIINESPKSK